MGLIELVAHNHKLDPLQTLSLVIKNSLVWMWLTENGLDSQLSQISSRRTFHAEQIRPWGLDNVHWVLLRMAFFGSICRVVQ